ncbi:MAG: hypothetical protein V1729_01020 [Candidatus Woesearchaeota archaeon]
MVRDISITLGYDRNNQGVYDRIYEGLPKERASPADEPHDNGLARVVQRQDPRNHCNGLRPEELFDEYE